MDCSKDHPTHLRVHALSKAQKKARVHTLTISQQKHMHTKNRCTCSPTPEHVRTFTHTFTCTRDFPQAVNGNSEHCLSFRWISSNLYKTTSWQQTFLYNQLISDIQPHEQDHLKLSSLAPCIGVGCGGGLIFITKRWDLMWTEVRKRDFFGVAITGEGWRGGRMKKMEMKKGGGGGSDKLLDFFPFNWFLYVPYLSSGCTLTFTQAYLHTFIINLALLDHPLGLV